MDISVIPETKTLVEFVCHGITGTEWRISRMSRDRVTYRVWRHSTTNNKTMASRSDASGRFSHISDEDVDQFCIDQQNENTAKKTQYDISLFKEFMANSYSEEARKLEDIPPSDLQPIIKKFVLAVRKKNGDEYEPSSVRAFVQSIDRYLRQNKYGISVLNDNAFCEVQDILKKKQRQLKTLGKGNRPNAAEPLSDEDILLMYNRGVLGHDSPRALLNTVWLNNCIFFGMRPGKEQRDMCWGDIQLKKDSSGLRFLEFTTERQTKTRTGENPRNLRETKPQMYEDKINPNRCPVNAYLAYKEHRPAEMLTDGSPFYLAVNKEAPKHGQQWYKCSPLGVNSLRSMLKKMASDAELQTDKKLVNHSTRKHLVQKLIDNEIPPNEIVQITGHKNVSSLNNYSTLSSAKRQCISAVLSNISSQKRPMPTEISGHSCQQTVSLEEMSTASTSYLPASSTAMPPTGSLLHGCHIGTVKITNIFQGINPAEKQIKTKKCRRIIVSESDESSQSQ